jgi:hypothetical protein
MRMIRSLCPRALVKKLPGRVATDIPRVNDAKLCQAGSLHGKLIFRRANITTSWGGSSAGRASRSQCEGREFEPPPLHQIFL